MDTTPEDKVENGNSDLVGKFFKAQSTPPNCEICKDVTYYTSTSDDNITCYSNNNFLIVVKVDEDDGFGSESFYVYRMPQKVDPILTLLLKDTLFTIHQGYTPHFYGFSGNYLLIDDSEVSDNGTLLVFDLEKGKKIVDENTAGGDMECDGEYVSYWILSEMPRDSVCPEQQEWEKYNSTRVIEKMKINLVTLKKESTQKYDCQPEQ